MNIRNKLLFSFLLITGLSVVLIATIAINSSTKTIHREVESALNSIIDEKIGFIYNYINNKEKTVAIYAHLPIVIESIQKLNSSFSEGIESLSYLRKNTLFRPALMHLKTSLDSYDLFLINIDGDIIFSITHEADFATNLRTGPYKSTQLAIVFEQATSLLETQISLYKPFAPSQYEIGSNIKKRINLEGQETHNAFIAAPIFKNNKLLGIIAIQLKSRDYFHLTKDYSGLKKTGDIIFSQQVNNQIQNISPLRNQPNSEFQHSISANSRYGIPTKNANKGEKGSGLSIDFEGTEVLAAWRYIPELQWGVIAKINATEAMMEAKKLEQQFVLLGIVILLFTSLIAIILSNKISTPIRVLADVSNKISEGDFSQKIQIKGTDELASLGIAFNHMCENLNQMISHLESSNKALEHSNKELDNFAYVASHDLKSPLRGIDQLATWIWEDIDDKEETIEHLQMMRNRVSRMECLLDDLLAYSRVGRVEQKINSVNSKYVLQSLFDLVSPPDTFSFVLKGVFPAFETVSVPFELVFRNLISNAIKHHHKADGTITISCSDTQDNYIFTVNDDGPGIAQKYHEKIFGLFQTLRSRDEVEGSGMGLAIIKKTLKIYGGNIEVQSEEGKGTRFIVTWPKIINISKHMEVRT